MLIIPVVVLLSLLPITSTGSMGRDMEPQFVGLVHNVTVVVGREAILSCQVTKLRDFKVGWIKADQTILTLHKRVITHNNRIHITHDMHNTWDLHIKDVTEEDQDCYMCQINTEHMKKQVGCVTVLVPPDIDQAVTKSDMDVIEGNNTTLSCVANGKPKPEIIWRRERQEPLQITTHGGGKTAVREWMGPTLRLFNVRREQMGAFLCIARNDVPPAVSRRIYLSVHFKPKVIVNNNLVGAPLGDDVEIECLVEAYPKAITYWKRTSAGSETILMNGPSYMVNESNTESVYQKISRLTITNFSSKDVGTYQCLSTNSLGTDHDVIRIYENAQVTEPQWRVTQKITKENRDTKKSTTASYQHSSKNVNLSNTLHIYKTRSKPKKKSGYTTTEPTNNGIKHIFSVASSYPASPQIWAILFMGYVVKYAK